jgi:hypothetical protein
VEIVIELAFSAMSRGDGIDDSGLGVTLALGGVSGGAKTQFGIFFRRLRTCSGVRVRAQAVIEYEKRRGATPLLGARLAAPAALAQRAP